MPEAGHYLWRGPTRSRVYSPWALRPPRLPSSWTLGDPELSPPLLRLTPAFTLVLGEQPLGHHA